MNKHAIVVSLDRVDPGHYLEEKFWPCAPKSGKTMYDILGAFNEQILLSEKPGKDQAMFERFSLEMEVKSRTLQSGDLLVVYFCCHGIRIPRSLKKNMKGPSEFGLCLFNRVLFYFELWNMMKNFSKGVDIVMLIDACGAGAFGTAGEGFVDEFYENDKQHSLYKTVFDQKQTLQHEVPPAVVAISSVPHDVKVEREDGLTTFIQAVNKALYVKGKNQNYLEFFARITKEASMAEMAPVWHYHQGHKRTDLPLQKIF